MLPSGGDSDAISDLEEAIFHLKSQGLFGFYRILNIWIHALTFISILWL